MKILICCLSPNKGGLEIYASRTIEWYKKFGHNCAAAVYPNSLLENSAIKSEIPYITLNVRNHTIPFLSARKLAKFIDAQQIDIIHIHWSYDFNLAVLAKLFTARKVKLVYTRHMGISRRKKDPAHRLLYKQVDKLIVCTKRLNKQAEKYLPISAEKIAHLYLGVPEPTLNNSQVCKNLYENYGLDKKRLKIGLIGRIEYGKGQHILISAVHKLIRKEKDVAAVIIGTVMDQDYFNQQQETIRKLGLEKQISFISYIENPQEIMKCLDVVVLTTFCETFGLVLIEAMRAGTAVIGTDAGGVPEIIENEKNGLLFMPGNADDLANKLERLHDDNNLKQKIAKAGKLKSDDIFSDTRHFEKLNTILENNV